MLVRAAIVNQLIFVYNLCMFGGLAGAGIFTAQYFGQKRSRRCTPDFRYKFWAGQSYSDRGNCSCIWHQGCSDSYLSSWGRKQGEITSTLMYGKQYLYIMLLGLPPFMLGQVYSSTLRECGETVLPMKAGVTAVCVNLVFNYLLIYGKFGFPELGVQGAAIATVLSRYVEVLIILIWTSRNTEKLPFIKGLYRTLMVPRNLVWKIFVKGTPLLLNEALWAQSGVAKSLLSAIPFVD